MIWDGSPLGFEKGRPLAHAGNEPTLILGPQGSNKTVGAAAIELLNDEGKRSFFVWDPKLELAAICANYRRRVCGAENVFIGNAYDLLTDMRPDLISDKWNPLAEHEATTLTKDGEHVTSPRLSDVCTALGDALIAADGNQLQKHFIDAARSALAGGIKAEIMEADAATPKQIPSLPNVRAVLTQDAKTLKKSVERMIAGGDFDVKTRLGKFLGETNTELENVRSNIESGTGWMSDAMRRDMVTARGMNLRALRERPTTIFCGLPPEEVKPPYMRLVLSSVLRSLYREGGVPTTLLIDEGYVLGRHDEVVKALSILRGFGSRMTIVFQSLQQIKQLYPDTWGLFTAGAVLAFRPGDLETAEWLSKRSGEIFMPSLSAADPSNPSDLGVRPSWGPQKRERISVGKMFAMPRGKALVWLPGDEAPRISRVKGYFQIPELAARADANPYYKGPATSASPPVRRLKRMAAFIAAGIVACGVTLWPSGGPSGEHVAGVAPLAAGVGRHDAGGQHRAPHAAIRRGAAVR